MSHITGVRKAVVKDGTKQVIKVFETLCNERDGTMMECHEICHEALTWVIQAKTQQLKRWKEYEDQECPSCPK